MHNNMREFLARSAFNLREARGDLANQHDDIFNTAIIIFVDLVHFRERIKDDQVRLNCVEFSVPFIQQLCFTDRLT